MNKASILTLSVLLIASCGVKVEPGLEAGVDQCENCSMVIEHIDHGAVAIDQQELMHTFCSPVCLILDANANGTPKSTMQSLIYLFDHESSQPIPAAKAVIVHGDFQTTMGHGLLAFASSAGAESFAAEVQGDILDWNDLRTRHETPDMELALTSGDPGDPTVFEVERGSLVAVQFANDDTLATTVKLDGYDFELAVPAASVESGKFVATLPGQGFVFRNQAGEILASLVVSGDHTVEEAVYR